MGHVVDVDPDRVDELALVLATVGEALTRTAQGAAHAWRRAAEASGGPELQVAARDAARRWGTDLGSVGEVASQLGRASAAAAEAYREVEQRLTWSFVATTGTAGRAARMAP